MVKHPLKRKYPPRASLDLVLDAVPEYAIKIKNMLVSALTSA